MNQLRRLMALSFVLLMGVSVLLTGCSKNTDNSGKDETKVETKDETKVEKSDSEKSDSVKEPIKLTFYYPVNVGGSAAQLIEDICTQFNAENPDVFIEAVYTGNYDDTVTKIQTAMQGGTPPDVFVTLANQRFTMASTEMAMPLDELIAADEEGQAYIDDFLPGFMEDSYVDGKIYSIPFQRSTEIMYYNKDLFEKAGLDPESPPTTWDELVEYSQKLTNDECFGVGLALNSGSAQWQFTGFSLENTSDGRMLMSEDGKEVYFDTPDNIEALQFWLDLQNKYKVMATGVIQWTDLPTQFLAQEVAMIYHTTGNMANINSNATFEFGTCFMPGNKQLGAPTGGGNLYIANGISEDRVQAAWRFIKFATDTTRASQWALDTGYVPTRKSCFETDMIKTYYEEVPQAKVAFEQLPYARPELTTYDAAQIWRILNDNIQAAVVGDMTAEEALKNAQMEADEVLAEYK